MYMVKKIRKLVDKILFKYRIKNIENWPNFVGEMVIIKKFTTNILKQVISKYKYLAVNYSLNEMAETFFVNKIFLQK